MAESISQKASIVAQVIEDLSYEPLGLEQFTAELYRGPKEKLIRVEKTPYYKDNGYFAFPNVGVGDYTLRILGSRFQTQQLSLTLAPLVLNPNISAMPQILAQTIVDRPGDNELIVVVRAVNAASKRITFDATTIRKPIQAGAAVLATGVNTKLAAKLEAGKVNTARVESLTGIAVGAIVRIVRDRSIRMRFDPYTGTNDELTRVAGAVTVLNQPGFVLPGALVSITKVNGTNVTVSDVRGAKVATVQIAGSNVVLGTERDIQTLSDGKGAYTLYSTREDITSVTLSLTLAGYQPATAAVAVTPRTSVRKNFQLSPI